MTKDERKLIDQYAEAIRNSVSLNPPITIQDMESLVVSLGGKVQAEDLSDVTQSGYVQRVGENSFLIAYNKSDSDVRNIFTIAHELGHLFLHAGFRTAAWNQIDKYIDSPMYRKGRSKDEVQANEFAAAFLMPRNEFKKAILSQIDKTGTNTVSIDEIANYFGVSKNAVLTRGVYLGYFSKF